MWHSLPSAAEISLRQLLPQSKILGSEEIRFASCCGDSRHVRNGDLFAALVGRQGDGHDFVQDAVSRGAAAILSERVLPISVPTCIVKDSREAYGRVCHALMDNPCNDLNVLGVTGTHGKTTISMLISAVLEAASCQVGIAGSLGYCDGEVVSMPANPAAPKSPELVRALASMRDNGCSHAVVEANSEGLARHSFAGMQLNGAVISNLRRAHLNVHGSVQAYRKIKERILSYLKPGGYVIVNADDPASRFVIPKIDAPLLTFGIRQPADVSAVHIERHASEQTFLLRAGAESIPVRTTMIGEMHIQNCLAAAAVGLIAGVDLATIARGLESVALLPGRMEPISVGQPFSVFVDTASTPDALAKALKTMRQVSRGKVYCVAGAQGDSEPAERALFGRAMERFADVGVITRCNPGNVDQRMIAHDVLDGYDRPANAHLLPDRARAIGWALHQAGPGDAVLIAGRGDASTEMVNGKQIHFDDRQVARFFLEKAVSTTSCPRRVA